MMDIFESKEEELNKTSVKMEFFFRYRREKDWSWGRGRRNWVKLGQMDGENINFLNDGYFRIERRGIE